MEIKLDSKLLKAVSGLFLLALSIMLMASAEQHWLYGLFMMFSSFALCGAWYLDGKKDCVLATKACFLFLFAIVFFAKIEALMLGCYFFILWAMIEAAFVGFDGWKMMEEKANLWFAFLGLAAIAFLMAFIGAFTISPVVIGLAFLFVALAQVLPMCLPFIPQIDFQLKK